MTTRSRRTVLAVPASNPRFITSARRCPADEIFLDLEDSCPPSAKAEARRSAVAALNEGGWGERVRAVRVNDLTTQWTLRDVVEVVEGAGTNLDSIILPKTTGPDHVRWLDLTLTQVEAAMGYPEGRIEIEPQIEDPRGLIAVDQIAAASPRVAALVFGPIDFMASMSMTALGPLATHPDYPGDPHHYPLIRVLVAARAHNLSAIDGPYLRVRDRDGLVASTRRSALLGYDGKWVVHPDQVETVNAAHTPSQADFDHAELVLDAYAHAISAEGGRRGAVMLGEEMIDEASRKHALVVATKGRAAGLRRTSSRESSK